MARHLFTLGAVIFAALLLPAPALSQDILRSSSMFDLSSVEMVHAEYLFATARVERSEEISREEYRQLEFISLDMDLRVEEVFFGRKPATDRLVVPPLRVNVNSIRIDGAARDPQIGDLVFFIVAPRKDGSYAWVAPFQFPIFEAADPIKLERLRKASKLLSMKDRTRAAELLLEACKEEEDPVFAEWCLEVLGPRPASIRYEAVEAVYGPLRAEIEKSRFLVTLWHLVEESSTHELVYVTAVRQLLLEDLAKEEQDQIHERTLMRISRPITVPFEDEGFKAWDYEAHQMLMYLYPKLRQVHRDLMLARLRLLAGSSLEKRCQAKAIRHAAYLYAPGDEAARRHVLHFYKDSIPAVREDPHLLFDVHVGILQIMQWEATHSPQVFLPGLHLVQSFLGDERFRRIRAAELLTAYGQVYFKSHGASDELADYFTKLLPRVENFEDRQILAKLSKQLRSSE